MSTSVYSSSSRGSSLLEALLNDSMTRGRRNKRVGLVVSVEVVTGEDRVEKKSFGEGEV
jgi:hypothetical protein